MTTIEWTERTWNPVAGCSLESPGCTNCYAMRMAHRLARMGQAKYAGLTKVVNGNPVWTGEVRVWAPDLDLPLRTRKSSTWFVDSMSDLFHKDVPQETQADVFGVMAVASDKFQGPGDGYDIQGKRYKTSWGTYEGPWRWPRMKHGPHRFQILTKRPDVAAERLNSTSFQMRCAQQAHTRAHDRRAASQLSERMYPFDGREHCDLWPLPNVWIGTSVEDRARKSRIDELREVRSAVRFLSIEPLLEDLGELDLRGIHWVIVGGESGGHKRPFNVEWARSIRDQCAAARVPFFMKQIDKVQPIPSDLMIREFPHV